jgi:hypothetical protein
MPVLAHFFREKRWACKYAKTFIIHSGCCSSLPITHQLILIIYNPERQMGELAKMVYEESRVSLKDLPVCQLCGLTE